MRNLLIAFLLLLAPTSLADVREVPAAGGGAQSITKFWAVDIPSAGVTNLECWQTDQGGTSGGSAADTLSCSSYPGSNYMKIMHFLPSNKSCTATRMCIALYASTGGFEAGDSVVNQLWSVDPDGGTHAQVSGVSVTIDENVTQGTTNCSTVSAAISSGHAVFVRVNGVTDGGTAARMRGNAWVDFSCS